MIMTGMAFGGGSAIGHTAVRSLMGGDNHNQTMPENSQQNQPQQNQTNPQQQSQSQQQQNPCMDYNLKFINCLKTSESGISSCQNLFDDLKSCEKKFI